VRELFIDASFHTRHGRPVGPARSSPVSSMRFAWREIRKRRATWTCVSSARFGDLVDRAVALFERLEDLHLVRAGERSRARRGYVRRRRIVRRASGRSGR
jgi:hypothetical protein